MSKRFVVTSLTAYDNRSFAGFFEDHKLIEANVVSKEPPLIGRIYSVKVENVSPNLNACFVKAGDGEIFYLPFEELDGARFIKKTSSKKSICAGDELLVQVTTEPIKSKNAVCSGRLTLSGTFCVIVSYTDSITVSKKLSAAQKERLLTVAENVTDKSFGIIIRTAAADAPTDVLEQEIKILQNKMSEITKKGTNNTPFACLYADRPDYIRLLTDVSRMTDTVITDDRDVYDELLRYSEEVNPSFKDKVSFYDDDYKLDKLYSFEHQIEKALKSTVYLPSGGNIMITVTEALTVIDVNTGSNVKKSDKESVILSTNLEAAKEVAFQLRLRNISGIVIVDFIDMDKDGEEEVKACLKQCTGDDKCKINILDFTKLGLLELTRQKKRQSLEMQIKK